MAFLREYFERLEKVCVCVCAILVVMVIFAFHIIIMWFLLNNKQACSLTFGEYDLQANWLETA